MIPYGRQSLDDSDLEAVADVLRSPFLTQGPAVPVFEQAVAEAAGARHAVAVNSATAGLHLACLALGLGPGDRLWTVPNTFVASANCALYCGAGVDFVDIDPATWCLSLPALTDKLERAARDGTLPKIVVPVHFAGQSCDMAAIGALADRYGFKVIEDAAHAIGGRYRDGPVGDGRWSDITVFSFHPVKIVTTGEGGAAVTNDPALARRLALLRSHGVTRDPALLAAADPPPWYYEQIDLGFNYRMTDIQAALGSAQMRRLEGFVARRNALAGRYDAALADLPLRLPAVRPECRSAWHLYVVRLDPARCDRPHRQVFEALRAAGIGVNLHYMPVHLQPHFRRLGFAEGLCPEAEAHGRQAITLPLFPDLTDEQQDRVVAALREAVGQG